MANFRLKTDTTTKDRYIETSLSGYQLLNDSYLNKGTAFSEQERVEFDLIAKLPPQIETIEQQMKRVYEQYQTQQTNVHKNIFLHELHQNNQVLFYKFVQTHQQEIIPILYTPNVATTVTDFSKQFRKPNGLYISYAERNNLMQILNAYSPSEIELVVVTDGEGVLGIGDQGIGSIHIPIAKLMLYTLFANINPACTLPIVLDLGTNNQKLLDDPMYLGWRHERLQGEQYDEFIALFIDAINKKFPSTFLHWEDFGRDNAARNLELYREKICSFNDDIQGTAVVTLAATLAALKVSQQTLNDQRVVIFGAGTAGTGIADQIVSAMVRNGISETEARKKFWLIDRQGLLLDTTPNLTTSQTPYAHEKNDIANWQLQNPNNISLYDVVKNVHPTILVGCSTVSGAFSEAIIKEMASHTARPIILPLSNPTEKCEAQPIDILNWTNGKALIATGSPFSPVDYDGKKIAITQCNNALSFPGIGLGVITAKAKYLSDNMLWAACQTLLEGIPITNDSTQLLLPPMSQASKVAHKIALAVALEARREGLSTIPSNFDIEKIIVQQSWQAGYLRYQKNNLVKF